MNSGLFYISRIQDQNENISHYSSRGVGYADGW